MGAYHQAVRYANSKLRTRDLDCFRENETYIEAQGSQRAYIPEPSMQPAEQTYGLSASSALNC